MNTWKLFALAVLLSPCLVTSSTAQIQFDAHIGYSPAQNINSQEIRVSNSSDLSYERLNPSKQLAGYTAGLGLTHTLESGFFLKGELQYRYSKTEFIMHDVIQSTERLSDLEYSSTEHILSVPISGGARLGAFRVLSGIDLNVAMKSTTTMSTIDEFDDSSSKVYAGWHVGLGYDINNFGLELRFSQDFKNHGQGYSIGGKKFVFYGNRVRWTILGKYYFG